MKSKNVIFFENVFQKTPFFTKKAPAAIAETEGNGLFFKKRYFFTKKKRLRQYFKPREIVFFLKKHDS